MIVQLDESGYVILIRMRRYEANYALAPRLGTELSEDASRSVRWY